METRYRTDTSMFKIMMNDDKTIIIDIFILYEPLKHILQNKSFEI